jgi:hypothetical protein
MSLLEQKKIRIESVQNGVKLTKIGKMLYFAAAFIIFRCAPRGFVVTRSDLRPSFRDVSTFPRCPTARMGFQQLPCDQRPSLPPLVVPELTHSRDGFAWITHTRFPPASLTKIGKLLYFAGICG